MYEKLPDRMSDIWKKLSRLLDAFGGISDRLDPSKLSENASLLKPLSEELKKSLSDLESELSLKKDTIESVLSMAAAQALQGAARFETAGTGSEAIFKAYQSFRPVSRSEEILYSLAGRFEEISRFFLHPSEKENRELLDRFITPHSKTEETKIPYGISDMDNGRGRRGGYTLYVPEYYTENRSWPLIISLHGGSGHGADFFWSWLRDARSFGFILASPTSLDRTWSLHSPASDAVHLNRMLSDISSKINIDTDYILLTGLSDGGTYSMILSTVHQSPFTHFAPVAAAVHALLNRAGIIGASVKDLPVYQVHGARDWMFPVQKARSAAEALKKAGAESVYREIPDMSHNYPRDENIRILKWFYPQDFDNSGAASKVTAQQNKK